MNLTERQAEIVEYIREFWARCGYSPSMEDIGRGLAISRQAAYDDVIRLRKKGMLNYTPGIRRSIVLLEDCQCPDSGTI